MTDHDPNTGEVLSDDDDRGFSARKTNSAADGKPLAKRSGYISDVIAMLEGGQFDADASADMRDLMKKMEAHAHNNKGVAKGSMDVKLSFSLANGVLVVTPDHKIKAPVEKRMSTALFIGESGSLGRDQPGQSALFGERAARDDYDGEGARQIRDA